MKQVGGIKGKKQRKTTPLRISLRSGCRDISLSATSDRRRAGRSDALGSGIEREGSEEHASATKARGVRERGRGGVRWGRGGDRNERHGVRGSEIER